MVVVVVVFGDKRRCLGAAKDKQEQKEQRVTRYR
jgi:hypothetical protein